MLSRIQHPKHWTMLLGVWIGLGMSWPASAEQPSSAVAVVVHRDVPIDSLTIGELRRVVLGDREFWPGGVRMTLLLRAPIAYEREVVLKHLCQMTEAQFRQHWIAKVFRADTALAPKIVYSTEMAVDLINRIPGAIAFVEVTSVGKGVKVLKIDGRLPTDRDYPLR